MSTHPSDYKDSTIAVIDIGSNTVRLLIARRESNCLRRIHTDRIVTRLGSEITSTGKLGPYENIEKTINCLSKFKSKCEFFSASKVYVVGTSALREATDSTLFLEKVRSETGLEIDVLSGEKEAFFTLVGVSILNIDKAVLAVDIGGGSTEFVMTGSPPLTISVPVGALKVYKKFIDSDIPSFTEIEEMKIHIDYSLKKAAIEILNKFDFSEAKYVFTGGTATTLASIRMGLSTYDADRINGFRLSYLDIKEIFEKLIRLTIAERSKISGMEPQRSDIIVSGTMITLCIMESLSIEEIIVSDYGLMEGIALTTLG